MQTYSDHVLSMYSYKTPQKSPVDLSRHLPDKKLHLKSIVTGLKHIRSELVYSVHSLQYYFSADLQCYDADTTSRMLTSSTVLLEGLLDGLVMCALAPETPPTRDMCFQKTPFVHQQLRDAQNRIKSLQSFSTTNPETYADFWTISNFWKHYLPCVPLPTEFDNLQPFDFQVTIGKGKSGPLIHDLIMPTFNEACRMIEIIGRQLGMEQEDWFVEPISR